MIHELNPHPAHPPRKIERVSVHVEWRSDELWLEYHMYPAGELLLPEMKKPERTNGLWQTTCCELFAQPAGGEDYLEFNFSPSFQWAAYQFTGYRADMRDLESRDPGIIVFPGGEHFSLMVDALPKLPATRLRVGLTAVIEELDGTKSFWALAHPSPQPDFHHAASFTLELPAAD